MQLSDQDLNTLCQIASEAAIEAGNIIRSNTNRKKTVQHKTAGESLASQVVTHVDFECQEKILEILSPTLKSFDLGLLTEEKKDDNSRFEKDYFWCIDPLDGTLPFIESKPGYSANIALVNLCGVPQLGVLFNPLDNVLYQSIINKGALRNNIPWTPSKQNNDYFHLFIDRSFRQQPFASLFIDKIRNIVKQMGCMEIEIIDFGGGAMNAIWVIENTPSCYVKFPKPKTGGGSLWDFATTTCIAKECGVSVSDIFGNSLELNRKDSTFLNHKGVIYASDQDLAQAITDIYHQLLKQTK